jgi:hypothetical protein
MLKQVTNKWEVDGNLAVIYQADNVLLFYTTEKDPNFKKDEMISLEKAEETDPYKALPFSTDNIPGDAYVSLTFSWQ